MGNPEVMESCQSGNQYKEINLKRKTNLLPLTKLNLGFAVTQLINSLKISDAVTNKEVQEFKKGVQEFIVEMSKLFEKSSLSL